MGQAGRLTNRLFLVIVTCLLVYSCDENKKTSGAEGSNSSRPKNTQLVQVPEFNADSAYHYVQKQVDFGPRVPGTGSHSSCASYLNGKLMTYGFSTIEQNAVLPTFDKRQYKLKNIIGSYRPELPSRILIAAHWDTRPWADKDTINVNAPFDGANDGASGVGVALEIARQVQLQAPSVGLDIIFFDLEDYGDMGGDLSSWCLGSQYWSENLHKSNYTANYGILLDMVGAPNAIFPKEGNSVNYASQVVNKVWNTAHELGYGNFFSMQRKDFVGVDDHIFINKMGIPCIDIVEYKPSTGSFGDYHHTHGDNMSVIDKTTLKAVGQTLLHVIYNEP